MSHDQRAKMRNAECRDWKFNITLRSVLNEGHQKKTDIHGNIEDLLGKICEVEKLIKF